MLGIEAVGCGGGVARGVQQRRRARMEEVEKGLGRELEVGRGLGWKEADGGGSAVGAVRRL